MATGADEIIVSAVSGCGAAGQDACAGNTAKPKRVDSAICRDQEYVVIDRDVLHGVLEIDVAGDVNTRISIEDIVVDRTAGDDAATLPPDMQAVVMVGISGRVPIHIIMDMIIVNLEAGHGSRRANSESVVDVVHMGERQSKIIAKTGEGPASIVAGDMSDREIVGVEPIDAIYALLDHRQVIVRSPNIDVRNRQILNRAVVAVRSHNASARLRIPSARTVRRVFDEAIGPAIDDDIAATVHVNCADRGPIRCGKNGIGLKLNGDRTRAVAIAADNQ